MKTSYKHNIYPIDIISYIYILLNLIYISLGRDRIDKAGNHLIVFSLLAIFIYVLIRLYRPGSGRFLTFVRLTYPLFFLSYFFNTSTLVDQVIFREYLDPFFQSIDEMIFGYQPAIEWGKRYNNFFLQELFHFAYFSYYAVLVIVAFLIFSRKQSYYPKYMFTVFFIFYACYITYSIFPVVGGRYIEELYELTMTYRGGIFTRIMAFIYSQSQHTGAAFPSSHVAITVVVNMGAYKYSPKLGISLIPLSILVAISTVYCHYHYFIDTVFGIIYAIVLFKPAEKLYVYLNNLSFIKNNQLCQHNDQEAI